MKHNMTLFGPVLDNSGVANFVRNQAISLNNYQNRLNVQLIPSTSINDSTNMTPIIQALINNKIPINETNLLQCSWCEQWTQTLSKRPKAFWGYTAIEGTKIPYNWIEVMNDPDVSGIFAMTNALKNLYVNNGVEKDKVHVIGHGVNLKVFNRKPLQESVYRDLSSQRGSSTTLQKESLGTPLYHRSKSLESTSEGKYRFLYLNGWTGDILGNGKSGREDRKGPEILLDAWNEAFKDRDDVELYFKVNKSYRPNMDIKEEIRKIGLDPNMKNLIIDGESYPMEEIANVYRNADCYVTPTKQEGFGITIAEAMACGIPVIVPDNPLAGYMDFCSKDTAILSKVSHDIEVDSRRMGHLYSGSTWQIPSTQDLIKKMEWVLDHREKTQEIANKAYDFIVNNYTWDHSTERIIKILDKYHGKI